MPRLSKAVASALVLLILASAPVSAVTRAVSMTGGAFSPKTVRAIPGDIVRWKNNDPVAHTTTRRSQVAAWNSGSVAPGATFSRTFTAAGTYGYVCTIHDGMAGTVRVALTAAPPAGTTATTFVLTWASIVAPASRRYQVQRRAPGAVAWAAWRTTTARRGTFMSATVGAWQFRARLQRNIAGTWVSGSWSPILKVTVSSA
jgi:plastocyanin